MKIGVFDSGKGGTVIFEAIRAKLPDEKYKYIADTKNCPYGEKSQRELDEIVTGITDRLIDWGAEIVVIACNTATTRCIETLRRKYPEISFVGTEPAIRLAVKSGAKRILVMATPGTVRSERMHDLTCRERQPGQEVKLVACPGLAQAIEHGKDIDAVLRDNLSEVKGNYDCVVLGCTHYSLIRDKIQKIFKSAKVIDGNEGVANRVAEIRASKIPSQ